jgi:hypothetical protein
MTAAHPGRAAITPLAGPAGGTMTFRSGFPYADEVIGVVMSKPVVVSVPHRLGREEAARRIRGGFERAGSQFAGIFNISDQSWNGDRLTFAASALGQQAAGTIDVMEDEVRIEVALPWLLARIAERLAPAIRRESVLMLEKK